MVGKWHLCKDADLSEAGRQALLAAAAGVRPVLRVPRGAHQLPPSPPAVRGQQRRRRSTRTPTGYYLTDDLTDRAVRDDPRGQGRRPGQAVLPLLRPRRRPRPAARQARRHRSGTAAATTPAGTSSASGASARQIELGIVARGHRAATAQHRAGRGRRRPGTRSPPTSRSVFARYMECYAAMVDNDRPRASVAIRADARASSASSTTPSSSSPATTARRARAEPRGTIAYFRDASRASGIDRRRSTTTLARLDDIGGPDHLAALPTGLGDGLQHAVPAVQDHHLPRRPPGARSSSPGPARIAADQIVRTPVHPRHRRPPDARRADRRRAARPAATDCPPTRSTASRFAPTLDDADAPDRAQRAVLRVRRPPGLLPRRLGGGHLPPRHARSARTTWQLFDASADVNELHDLADRAPRTGRRAGRRLGAGGLAATRCSPSTKAPAGQARGPPVRRRPTTQPVRILPGTPTLERYRSSRLIARRTFSVTVDWDYRAGDQGVLVAHGGQEGRLRALGRGRPRSASR